MSKSLGNVVSPHEIIDKFGVDAVRYFLLNEGALANDGDFSYERLYARLKGDLADNFGNLVSRCTSSNLLKDNKLPEPGELTSEEHELMQLISKIPGFYHVTCNSH